MLVKYKISGIKSTKLFLDVTQPKTLEKLGVQKSTIIYLHPPSPIRFSKLEYIERIWAYRFLHSEISKKFFIFKIDVHTLSTQKNQKNAHIAIKKILKMCFYHYLWWILCSRTKKVITNTVLNILNRFLRAFNLDRPESAKIRILACFFS